MSDQPEILDNLNAQRHAHREFAEQVFTALDNGTDYAEDGYESDPHDTLAERPLSIDVTRRVTILMGTGGPHTELVADLDRDGYVTAVAWHGYWGGERAEVNLSRRDPLWRLAEHYVEYFTED